MQGHPCTHDKLPGVRMASGSLGQGLSVGIGAAQTKKLNKDEHLVYVLLGDGELQEGQNWEAMMYASANKIDNLIATVDLNGKQIDGPTEDVLNLGSMKAKFEAFDWTVIEIKEGNSIDAILKGYEQAKALTKQGKPVCVLLHTEMGNGVDFMMGTHAWHGKAPNDAQLEEALKQNPETSFGDY
ncbi:transketolase N-terminal domain/subunit [Myroides gitamensis]|nr:transketolase N-terminal domain/subunit [Myroides gitamensis]